ncbi:hypothetical protein JXB02_00605 [Candidatus Woesearchaeota archaeon]|nr:hypothetical protein [Candidatus Woesearchaeota archaeon]
MSSFKFTTAGTDLGLKVIVEAGHIYTNDVPGSEHELGARIGAGVGTMLGILGFTVENWLFIDNYNPSFEEAPQALDEREYLASLAEHGFSPGTVVYEADLVPDAARVLDALIAKNVAGTAHGGSAIVLRKGNINLYDPGKGKYFCSMLDACLYLRKLEGADATVTVLDSQFKEQQKGTLAILKKYGVNTDVIVPLYYETPAVRPHHSVDTDQVYAGGRPPHNGGSHLTVADVVHTLSLLGRIGTVVSLEGDLDFEAMRHVV